VSDIPEHKGRKRDQIRSLIAEGGYDAKSIARLANTTEKMCVKRLTSTTKMEESLLSKEAGKAP
jgi:hypothetical protein